MIRREGIGDLLADGSKIAARKIGGDAEKFAIHAGGQELGMHDGRNDPGFNVHYSVEPTPGRHTLGSQLYDEMFQLWKRVPGLPKPHLIYSKNEKYVMDREAGREGGRLQQIHECRQRRRAVPPWRPDRRRKRRRPLSG